LGVGGLGSVLPVAGLARNMSSGVGVSAGRREGARWAAGGRGGQALMQGLAGAQGGGGGGWGGVGGGVGGAAVGVSCAGSGSVPYAGNRPEFIVSGLA